MASWVCVLYYISFSGQPLFVSPLLPRGLATYANPRRRATVQPTILNVFYKYVFHYWDYQKYVFEGMLVNEFADRNYSCGDSCQCMFVTPLVDQCMIAGQGVLDQYGYKPGHTGRNVGIMIAIIAGYRIAGWLVLVLKRS